MALIHAFVLEALKNPFAPYSADPVSIEELWIAARICSAADDAQLQQLIDADGLAPDPAELDRWRPTEAAEYLAWRAYVRDIVSTPRLLPTGQNPGKNQNNYLLLLASKLMMRGHCTRSEAWWTPIGVARWHCLAFDELRGGKFELLTEESAAEFRRMGHDV